MKCNKLIMALLLCTVSCFDRPTEGNDLSQLGFYSTPDKVIETLKGSSSPGYREHYLLGTAYHKKKQYKNAMFHYINSSFSAERSNSIRLFASPVFRFLDGYHTKSPYYNDAVYHIAELFYLYREFRYVVKFIDLMDSSRSALYRDAVILKSRAHIELKEYDKAIESLKVIIEDFRDDTSLSLIHIRLASAYLYRDDHRNALKSFLEVIKIDPSAWQARIASKETAAILRQQAGIHLDTQSSIVYASGLYHAGQYDSAVEILKDIVSTVSETAIKENATELLVRSLIRKRSLRDADTIIDASKNTPRYYTMIKLKADEFWRSGKRNQALTLYNELKSKNIPDISRDSLRRMASYMERRNRNGFMNLMKEFCSRFPDDPHTERFRMLLAQHLFRNKNFSAAEEYIRESLKRTPEGDHSDFMRFWTYRFMERDRNTAGCLKTACDMIRINPASSYTWILLDKIAVSSSLETLQQELKNSRNDSSKTLYYHTLLSLKEKDLAKHAQRIADYSIDNGAAYRRLERKIETLDLDSDFDDALTSLEKYFAVGDMDAINRELAALPEDDETAIDKYTALAHFGFRYNQYHLSTLGTIQLLQKMDIKNNIALMQPKTILRLYPMAFKECVERYAGKFSISPNLMYAVIRAESLYNNEAVSSAGAIGLMQLMPPTARGIARQLHIRSYDLKDPCTSAQFGGHYLQWLTRVYNGNIALMVAGYNAGAGNVAKWKAKYSMDDIEMFTEQIPFDETRYYVLRTKKHVIQGSLVYK
ncbi:MAG TPA: transglycosylase SLT domain-containing protein [Spirochaetota bacterium]|nr:transglycosylase SLT domain-containing protein [Spirochaetota bacterium]